MKECNIYSLPDAIHDELAVGAEPRHLCSAQGKGEHWVGEGGTIGCG